MSFSSVWKLCLFHTAECVQMRWYMRQFEKHTSNPVLCLDFVAVTAENAENAISYKQVVVNGSRTLTALLTVVDTPWHMLSRKTTVEYGWNASAKSSYTSCSSPFKSMDFESNQTCSCHYRQNIYGNSLPAAGYDSQRCLQWFLSVGLIYYQTAK